MDYRPLVSVIIPAYNADNSIRKTIKSVLFQTYDNIEVVVVDDGSVDSTCDEVEILHREDSRVLLVRAEHGGVSHARNEGLKIARGEFLTFCDADDAMPPQALETLVSYARGIDIVAGGMSFEPVDQMDSDVSRYVRQTAYETLVFDKGKGSAFDRMWDANYLQSCWSKLFFAGFIHSHRIAFDETLSSYEDLDFVLRCLAEGAVFSAIPDICYRYLTSPTGTGYSRFKPDASDQMQRVAERVVAFYEDVLGGEKSPACYKRVVQLLVVAVNNALKAPGGGSVRRRLVADVFSRPIFSESASNATMFPNRYSRLIVRLGARGYFGAVTFLATCRNMVRGVRVAR